MPTPRKDPTGVRFQPGRNPRITRNGYRLLYMPWHPNAGADGYLWEHVWVMSRMIAAPVPEGMQVHHMDGDKLNNSPSNLMLCDQAQHSRMHMYMASFAACGNPDWRICRFCGKYRPTHEMVPHSNGWCHRECRSESWHSRKHRYKLTRLPSGKKSSRLRDGVERSKHGPRGPTDG